VTDTNLTGAELRAKYGIPAYAPISEVLSHVDPAAIPAKDSVVLAFEYPTAEAHDAFAAGNQRRHGHQSIGPILHGGKIYGVTVLNMTQRHGAAGDTE
jgi:hypothetical protein